MHATVLISIIFHDFPFPSKRSSPSSMVVTILVAWLFLAPHGCRALMDSEQNYLEHGGDSIGNQDPSSASSSSSSSVCKRKPTSGPFDTGEKSR